MNSVVYLFPGPREQYLEELQFLGEEDNVNYQKVHVHNPLILV